MSWMDLNDYVALEGAARQRLDDLFKHDSPRRIDEIIDYFGETGTTPAPRPCSSAPRSRGWRLPCILQSRET